MCHSNSKKIVTDEDIQKFQMSRMNQAKDNISSVHKSKITFKALIDEQLQKFDQNEVKINNSVSFDNKQNQSVNIENRKSVYISSRISR